MPKRLTVSPLARIAAVDHNEREISEWDGGEGRIMTGQNMAGRIMTGRIKSQINSRTKIGRAGIVLLGIMSLALPVFAHPVLAHTTEISGDVAGTWHIEPNHSPRAGEPAQVWIALTRQGGTIVPLEQCECQLAVYPNPRPEAASPILKPPLAPVSAEQYQGIPGAEIRFPQAGQYELELRGSPKAEAEFQPFTFRYSVLVQAGAPPRSASQPSPNPSNPASAEQPETATPNPFSLLGIILITLVGTAFGIAVLVLTLQQIKARKK